MYLIQLKLFRTFLECFLLYFIIIIIIGYASNLSDILQILCHNLSDIPVYCTELRLSSEFILVQLIHASLDMIFFVHIYDPDTNLLPLSTMISLPPFAYNGIGFVLLFCPLYICILSHSLYVISEDSHRGAYLPRLHFIRKDILRNIYHNECKTFYLGSSRINSSRISSKIQIVCHPLPSIHLPNERNFIHYRGSLLI